MVIRLRDGCSGMIDRRNLGEKMIEGSFDRMPVSRLCWRTWTLRWTPRQ